MKRNHIITVCILLVVFSFAVGVADGAFKLFPYGQLVTIYDHLHKNTVDNNNVNSQLYNDVNVTSLIHIHSILDVSEKRSNLIRYIWHQNSPPQGVMPSDVEENISDKRYSDLRNLSRIDKITTSMDYDVNSFAYLFLAEKSNNKLIIYHQGHDGDFILGKDTIQNFLDKGYSVLAFSMPLLGMNNQPIADLPNFGILKLTSHEDLKYLESDSFSPIKFFVEPIFVSLNYIDKKFSFDSYYMIGISGGGWTTELYSAIDPRIVKSYSVAGSVPMYLRFNNLKNDGDYEQTLPSLYKNANYLDIYILGSYGKGRSQLQVFNEHDPCCFSGTGYKTYEGEIKKVISNLGEGKFSVFSDSNNEKHSISDDSLKIIFNDMEK